MSKLYFILALLITSSSFAQYNYPYRLTSDSTNYFITNRGNGTISKLDSSFTRSTVISNLHSPNDIFFASVLGNSAIIIIDSNQIKLFSPSTYTSMLNINISNATEAHDGVFNPTNNNEFYISDRGGNKIIKGNIGGAPLYQITFSTLAVNIPKPAGMIFNNSGELLVVTDTANARVYKINTSTGFKTTVLNTSLNQFNDIAQDNEGNYYVTCWGTNNLYRYNSSFGNQSVVASYNNPSGLYANTNDDFLAIACHNCQKVEFSYFHLFSPLSDVHTCTNDSFFVDFTPTYKGIGTYKSNNKFQVEMSDSNGIFSNAIVIGEVSDSIRPASIKASVPNGEYSNSGYKYRLKSTSPKVFGYFEKELNITSGPNANIFDGDTAFGCTGSNLPFTISSDSNTDYSWFPALSMQKVSNGQYNFTNVASENTFAYLFQAKDTVTGCVNTDSFIISIKPSLTLSGLQDSLSMCLKDTLEVITANPAFKFSWDNVTNISDSTSSSPKFFGTTNTLLKVLLADSAGTCAGSDSVFITVNNLPILPNLADTITFCEGATVQVGDTTTNYSFLWSGSKLLSNLTANNPTYLGYTSTNLYVEFTDTNTQCINIDSIFLNVNPLPTSDNWLSQISACQFDTLQLGDTAKPNIIYQWKSELNNFSDSSLSNPLYFCLRDSSNFSIDLTLTDTITKCTNTLSALATINKNPKKPILILGLGSVYSDIYYENATYKWTWRDFDGKDTTVFSDTNSISSEPFHWTTALVLEIIDSNGCSSISEKFEIIRESVVEQKSDFTIYPNPAHSIVTIQSLVQVESISIYAVNGTLLSKKNYTGLKANLDLTYFSSGMYFVEIETLEGIGRKRLIIK